MSRLNSRLLVEFVVDTLAVALVSTIAAAPVEFLVVGLTFDQVVAARWRGAIVNLLTGGVYGRFRDWIYLVKFRAHQAGPLKQYFAKVTAFGLFQVPLYILVLLITGAEAAQIIRGCIFILVISPFVGPALDRFIVWCRRLAGIEAASS